MSHPPTTSSTPIAAPASPRERLALGLRDFARAARHIHDLSTFLEILQAGLAKTGIGAAAELRLAPPGATLPADAFGAGRLTLPVGAVGRGTVLAQLAPSEQKQHFGAEDLHLLSGLAELIGSTLDVARTVEARGRSIAALKAVLNFAPVGICTFDGEGRVETINKLASGWLGLAEGDLIAGALPAGVAVAELRRGSSFHLRVAGRLLFCETRPNPDADYTAIVVTDLTPEQGRLLDSLNREVYRGNHLRRPMHFLLLERTHPMGALLAAMPAMRAAIGGSAIVGPYDAARIGLIFADATWSSVILQLRKLTPLLAASEVRVGRAELRTYGETPETVIQEALDVRDSLARVVRPRVLVHDEYRGVGEALRLVLADDCEVVGCTDLSEANRLLHEQHFDVLLADISPVGGGADLVARARARNQRVKAFYLSGTLPQARSGGVSHGADVPVFSKPFDVEQVRRRVLASLAAREEVPA